MIARLYFVPLSGANWRLRDWRLSEPWLAELGRLADRIDRLRGQGQLEFVVKPRRGCRTVRATTAVQSCLLPGFKLSAQGVILAALSRLAEESGVAWPKK